MKHLLFSVSVKDCEQQFFRVSGAGGGGKDTSSSGVRLIHHPSGARAEGRETRFHKTNRKSAFLKLIETAEFKVWHKAEVQRLLKIKDVAKHSQINTGFGNSHIRTYTLSGKKKVKDHRTGHERFDVDKVMNGDIDSFLKASASL